MSNWDLTGTKEYEYLMIIANNSILMDQFYVIIKEHFEKHTKSREHGFPTKYSECMFCMMYMNW